jgi:hypothetical protein
MEELERLFPEISKMNKQEGAYLNLFEAIEKSVPRIANQKVGVFNPFNLSLAGGAGYATGSPLVAIGALGAYLTLKDPVVQSYLAIALKKSGDVGRKAISQVPSQTGQALFQAGKIEDEANKWNVP